MSCFSEFCLKDSFSFAQEIQTQDSTLYMASMDVESLFTNIPLKETITICSSRLFFKKRKVGGLLKRHFEQLLLLATTQSCFIFNETYYQQIDGVAMGSPLGPSLANIFMSFHEENWIAKCPTDFKPIYYRRYVDDVIVLFKDRSHLPKFQEYLNSQHKNIKFTIEEEVENSLPFLDILITRKDGKFTTSLYRKVTFSGVYSNYKSHIAKSYKLGLVLTLIHRIYTICSSYANLHLELENIKDILLTNGYPLFIIDGCIKKFLYKIFTRQQQVNEIEEKKRVVISLPFLGKMSLQMKKSLISIFKITASHIKLRVVFVSNFRLKNKFKFKDPIPKDLRSLVLYTYKCNSCNAIYHGKTKRHYKVRINEHLGMSIVTEKSLKFNAKDATAIREHCHGGNHNNSIDNFGIVGSARNDYYLRIKESLMIYRTGKTLNKAGTSIPLHLFN